ncbi:hypothetical protein CVAR_2313 [Corynebacterium variabile DSM 44702]|uniref:Uncharacterized protein n=1 Tax=Corynebacterium variabile (strain DSM 44702 / CIP 107183 / JCM 12073 / NCIMB 30131) TaxID=858619 RepID=G0HGQ1_CORVD|nr:hypothetical protein [Corynebacterium variabile]AEK37658.1 hypothetical protein CVAR_2313 [Corynebacterium variabile DSM 44702]
MSTFTTRATVVADNLAGLGLGSIVPTAYDEMSAADARVEAAVDRVRAGLTTDVDLDSLAADLVAGKVTPSAAGKKLMGPAGARVSNLVEKVREHAVAAEDRDEWSPAALRRSCVEVVGQRLQRTAEDMLTSIEALPSVAKAKLAEVVDTSYGPAYGPLTADQLAGLLDVVAPGGLSTVRPDQLAAVQRAQAAWSWWNGSADAFGPLWYLSTGREVRRGWDTNDVTGDGAAEAEQFDPALLLVDGDAVDYVAAGVPLAFAVASGLVESFDVLADPFGEDAEAYQARVARLTALTQWRDSYRTLNMSGAAGLIGGPDQRSRAALRRRAELPKLDQVAAFRDSLDEKVEA